MSDTTWIRLARGRVQHACRVTDDVCKHSVHSPICGATPGIVGPLLITRRGDFRKCEKCASLLRVNKPCVACGGSGYYDTQVQGKAPRCHECNGTGVAPAVPG